MFNLRNTFFLLLMGILGGFLAQGVLVPFFIRTNFLYAANLLNQLYNSALVITKVEEKTIVAPQAEYYTKAINEIKKSVVSVQSFSNSKLIRTGSGIVVTQDGLIITLNSLVPVEANVYQVSLNSKKFNAKVLSRNQPLNLAVISIPESNLNVTKIKKELPELGKNVLAFAMTLDLGKTNSYVVKTIISQIVDEQKQIKVPLALDQSLFGSALVDEEGALLGLVEFRGFANNVMSSQVIEEYLNKYLSLPKK